MLEFKSWLTSDEHNIKKELMDFLLYKTIKSEAETGCGNKQARKQEK